MPKIRNLEFNLTCPIAKWSVEDYHQLRIFVRHLRVLIWMVKKEKKSPTDLKKINSLEKLTKKLLEESGAIRDLDVLLEILQKLKLDTKININKLENNRKRKIIYFKNKWPISKRRNAKRFFCWFIEFINENGIIKRKLLREKSYKIYKNLKKMSPKTKTEWHNFRRQLRRLNYLLELQKIKNPKLLKFQKILGAIHDFEILQHVFKNEYSLQKQEKRLNSKAIKYLKQFRCSLKVT